MFQVQDTSESLINKSDATIGNTFETKKITQLPIEGRNVANLLSLQTGVTRDVYVGDPRANQASITLDGVDINERENGLTLVPVTFPYSVSGAALGSIPITIELTNSPDWISLRLLLETHAKHTDYRITIRTTDGRPITSADWIEPLTPNQTVSRLPCS